MIWEDAEMCIILGRFDLFSRNKEILDKYAEYKEALQRNNIAIEDVIRKKMKGANITWMKNAFPYDVDNSLHYLIFSTLPLSKEKIREIASVWVGSADFMCFVNPKKLRSVQLWHAHCLIRRQ
jgi:hypothetical protein